MLRKLLWTGLLLETLPGKAAAKGGVAGKPKDAEPGSTTTRRPAAPSGPQHARSRQGKRRPNPFLVAGAAFGAGTLLAKLIDWRGHAHPRR